MRHLGMPGPDDSCYSTGTTKAKPGKGLPTGKDRWLGDGDNHTATECGDGSPDPPPDTPR